MLIKDGSTDDQLNEKMMVAVERLMVKEIFLHVRL